jgi:uncharacterized protein (DUF2267 family)
VGQTLAETRVEVAAQRATNDQTATELEARIRRALDIRARFRENPALFIGLGVGAVFLLVGGPSRVARTLRRRLRPSNADQAYDALPKPMQAWVDSLAAEVGPKAGHAREALIEELQRWRREPIRDKKARRELAKAMVEGPPGPSRAAWKAAEAALMLVSAALARKAIEAFITRETPSRAQPAPTKPAASKDQAPPGWGGRIG